MMHNNLYCIIPDHKRIETHKKIETMKAAVFVNLFYEDQVDFYRTYLEKIPTNIDIIIISSKNEILDEFRGNRYQKIKKKNRGRDISALLVASKNLIFNYEYICFIHDKRERSPDIKEFTDSWKKNLWDNMLQSDIYIDNLLAEFANDPRIGILVPLPPHGRDLGGWLKGCWGKNYENTKRLAAELGIAADLIDESPPVAYSTVFWAKSKVLEKLFSKDWKYSDFPEEPMRNDGEINHAIERILEYVVKDAGYEIKIALSASFAGDFIEQLHEEMKNLWDQLDRIIGVDSYKRLDSYSLITEKIRNFAENYTNLYLYGGGKRGRECLVICRLLGIDPKGFLVTESGNMPDEIEQTPVFPIADVVLGEGVGIIISVGSGFQREIEKELEKRNFKDYIVF